MMGNNLAQLFRQNERLATLVNHVLVSLMLACLVYSIVQFLEYLMPYWEGSYLVWVCFLLSVEGMYSRRIAKTFDFLSREWVLYRVTEWVVILVVLKFILYLATGFDRLWTDLSLWRQDFANNFFSNDYIMALGLVIVVWLLAALFSADLERLEGDEKLLKQEMESGITEVRPAVRQSMADKILVLGGLMVILAAFMRFEWEALWGDRFPVDVNVANVLIFFLLALVLLSLTQFSILRVHWSMERIPISAKLASSWVTYSLVFLLLLGVLAILLPTRYSIGLLDILGYLIFLLNSLMTLILLVLMAPLFFLMSLLARLFGTAPPETPPPVMPPTPPPAPAAMQGSWLELLKSIIFWSLFLGIVGYSIYHYLLQNKALMVTLRRLPFLSGLERFWIWLLEQLRGVNQQVSRAVAAGIGRLRTRRPAPAAALWRFVNLHRLSPRQRVFFFYLAMIRRGAQSGLPREPSQTPYEYSKGLRGHLPEVENEVSSLTEQFVEARYSLHEVTPESAGLVQRYWERIKRALRRTFRS